MTDEEFHALRPLAFAIAYRMLGSVSEAEDIVQEGFLRLHRAREGNERIESPRAYLSTVVSRLSLDHLRSARARRETYAQAAAGAREPLLRGRRGGRSPRPRGAAGPRRRLPRRRRRQGARGRTSGSRSRQGRAPA